MKNGWKIFKVYPPRENSPYWKCMACWWQEDTASDCPDHYYTGTGATREEAIAQARACCSADQKYPAILENFDVPESE